MPTFLKFFNAEFFSLMIKELEEMTTLHKVSSIQIDHGLVLLDLLHAKSVSFLTGGSKFIVSFGHKLFSTNGKL